MSTMDRLNNKKIILFSWLIIKIKYLFFLFLFLRIIVECCSAQPTTSGNTYYMSTSGSNSNDGSINSPWATLQYAQTQLNPGDILYIRGGVYNERVTNWEASGTGDQRITVSGYPGENAVFDGNFDTNNFIYDVTNKSYVTIKDLEIRNYDAYLVYLLHDCHHWIFENLYMHDIGTVEEGMFVSGIIIDGRSGSESTYNIIRNCTGINLGTQRSRHHWAYFGNYVYHCEIYNNYFENAASAGIHSYHDPGGGYNKIYNNIIVRNNWGYINGNGEEYNEIYNNVFYKNKHAHTLDIRDTNTNIFKNNIIIGNNPNNGARGNTFDYNIWYPDWDGKGPHGISVDPASLFVSEDPKNVDEFRLRANSPAIDAGETLSAVTVDYDGKTRLSGNAYDIGAFEYGGVINLIVTNSSLPSGIIGEEYNVTLQAINGTPPYVWSLISGNLPAGLDLNPNGVINGIPIQAGQKSFTVQVKDANNSTASKQLSIAIIATPDLIVATSSLPSGIIGKKYDVTLQASNGTPPYVWSLISGNLPAGLNLSSNGVIDGIPIQAGQKSFTVQVKDANNSTANKTLSMTITASQESGSDFNAVQTDGFKIDGNLSEFIIANSVSFGDNSGRGVIKDNNAIARVMWDKDYLYIGVEVTDTELNAIIDEDNNSSLFRDDCIEIFIDSNNDGGSSMQSDDYRYTVNLNEKVREANGFQGWSWDGNILKKVSLNGTLNNNSDTDIGYTITVSIPFSDLGITPIAGKILGLQIGITDRDEEVSYEYFGWPIANSSFNNPDQWAEVKLLSSPSQITAVVSISDLSPTKAGIHEVTLVTTKNVVKTPTPLIFMESDGTTTTINLTGTVPGKNFTGSFNVDNNVADGLGSFSLLSGALEDEQGHIDNRIISGASIKIDKTPPVKPLELNGLNK